MKQSKLRFQSHDPKRRGVELDFLFELRVRRVIAGEDPERAVGDSLQQRSHIVFRRATADSF